MRRLSAILLASLISIGVLLSFAQSSVRADDLTPDQVERVKANCVSIKNTLGQLHASDALLRVNRGQVYEQIASKYMEAFNSRLASNRLDNKAMVTVGTNYRSALDTFRADYIAYEQKLSSAIKIDCEAQPNSFHTALQEARTLRAKVHDDVLRLHRYISDYRTSVGDFLLNYERVAE